MHLSTPFKIMMVSFLMASISLKIAAGGGVRNPNFDEVKPSLESYLSGKGYEIGGAVRFADLDGIAAMKQNCLLYVLPVAHQGWNETTILQQIRSGQEVFFIYNGQISRSDQPRLIPTLSYYSSKFFSYVGLRKFGFAPMLAVVTSGSCSIDATNWEDVPLVPFPALELFDG